MEQLKALSDTHVITSVAKLHQMAQRSGIKHTPADLRAALSQNVGKQVLAPLPRYQGKSAALNPGSHLQADLADMHNKDLDKVGAHHYALVVSDVFTRQTWAAPLRMKTAEATNAALRGILAKVPRQGEGISITTDKGKEFAKLDSVLEPLRSVHREKEGQNDIAIVDRAMQTVKVRLAEARANQGGTWSKPLDQVIKGYNATPHSAVHGAPETAGDENIQGFMNLQDQAGNYEHNRRLATRRQSAVEASGAFREAVPNGGRSFKPAYGPVRKLREVAPGGTHVIDEEGNKALIKRVQAVKRDTAEPQAVFGTKTHVRKPEADRAFRPYKAISKKIPKAASRVFEQGSSGSGMSAEQREQLAPESQAVPKPMHNIQLQIHSYVAKTTPAQRAASAKESAAKKAQKALAVAQKKSLSIQKSADKEVLRQRKAMMKAFK